jgi:hypothetical protein
MTISVGDAVFNTLTAQPLTYDEKDTPRGITARKWSVSGLLTPSEWLALLDVYDQWRDIKITEENPTNSLEEGTTVLLTGNGPGGSTWSANCWFTSTPKGEQVGSMIAASVDLVDAAQSLQIISKDAQTQSEPPVDLGTVTVGSGSNIATIALLRPMETYGEGPSLELAAYGGYYTTGPLTVRPIRDIEGTTTSADWDKLKAWYESIIVTTPVKNSWYPISIPSATVKNKLVNGIKELEYTVTIQLAYVI